MSTDAWTDRIAAERLQTDQEFTDRIDASPLSNQQWSLVMTAVEFEIEGPDDPDSAELVADTSKLSSVTEEIRRIGEQSPGRGTGGGGGASTDSGGLFGGIASALGLGGTDDELRETAEALAAEYASELQTRLEKRDRWDEVCELARNA